jgi:hypothetical protein
MDCNRRVFVKRLGFVLLGFPPFLKACNRPSGESQSKEEKMQTHLGTQISSVPRKSTPPIDAGAPTRFVTATFALG